MSYQTLMEVRAALTTQTNTGSTNFLASQLGGVEIQKKIEELPIEAFNKMTDLRQLIRAVNINQLAYIWNVVSESSAGSGWTNTSFTFYAETATGTARASTKQQLFAITKAYRADYQVSNLMIAAGMGNQLTEEARYAAEALALGEEKQIILGANTTAGGSGTGFLGLHGDYNSASRGGLMLNGVATTSLDGLGDTSTIFGLGRTTVTTNYAQILDTQAVDAVGVAAGGTAVALALNHLDSAITKSNKRGGKNNRRIFLMSEERVDKVAALLQAQQRFVSTGNTVEFDGGFRVLAYRRIPIIGSRFMENVGVTKTSSLVYTSNATDNCIYLLDIDNLFMAYVGGVNAVHTPIIGDGADSSADVQGGYYKSYGVLVMKRFDTHVLIFNLENV